MNRLKEGFPTRGWDPERTGPRTTESRTTRDGGGAGWGGPSAGRFRRMFRGQSSVEDGFIPVPRVLSKDTRPPYTVDSGGSGRRRGRRAGRGPPRADPVRSKRVSSRVTVTVGERGVGSDEIFDYSSRPFLKVRRGKRGPPTAGTTVFLSPPSSVVRPGLGRKETC